MSGKFQIDRAKDGSFFFHLNADNGRTILSSETYVSKSGAEKGIESVRTNATQNNRYERRTDSRGRPYFVLKATNEQVIGKSQMYASDDDMEHGIESVKKNAPHAALEDLTVSKAA